MLFVETSFGEEKQITQKNKASIAKLVWCIALKKDILWVKWIHTRLPVISRLARFTGDSTHLKCVLCNEANEDLNHLFFQCSWSTNYWRLIQAWAKEASTHHLCNHISLHLLNLESSQSEAFSKSANTGTYSVSTSKAVAYTADTYHQSSIKQLYIVHIEHS
ncbi:hypothetical protein Cgig2_013532 [Carnegiea gigantea]|uniref:Reverse transcriptase zinc-binding domain-containing protein n=1 Tax=Carnegiea gigantea TaxID=171969 RepID=A0A9Q1GHK1_9CARY|nr:hypothetical protein Cgig2_013532 [Carnegiea gigantea]